PDLPQADTLELTRSQGGIFELVGARLGVRTVTGSNSLHKSFFEPGPKLFLPFLGNHTGKAEGASCIGFEHLYLIWSRRKTGIQAHFQPLQPMLPPIRNGISMLHLNQSRLCPVLSPPVWAVEAPPLPLPIRGQVSRKLAMQFMEQARNDDRDGSPR